MTEYPVLSNLNSEVERAGFNEKREQNHRLRLSILLRDYTFPWMMAAIAMLQAAENLNIQSLLENLKMNRYALLLFALIMLLLVFPLLEQRAILGRLVMHTGFSIVYISGLWANRQHPLLFKIGIIVAVMTMGLIWMDFVIDAHWLIVAQNIASVLFVTMIAVMILISVFRDYTATIKAVLGAICVYLLLGLAWASMYRTAELVESEPLHVQNRLVVRNSVGRELTAFSQLVYFSFVTMTTLGYGDMAPRTSLTRNLAWTQAVVGQFYIAVLVAWLVSALPKRRRE